MLNSLKDWVFFNPDKIIYIGVSVSIAYAALIILTRLGGIRSFSKMSGFDFAVTVAIGSVFASMIMSDSPPVLQGVTAFAFLFAFQIGFANLRTRSKIIRGIAENAPRLIMVGDKIIYDQLRKADMTKADLMGKLREANVVNFSQVKIVIAETTGDVSVLHHAQDVQIHPDILDGITGADKIPQHMIDTKH